MSRGEAESRARREFGNVSRIEEQGREAWMWPGAEAIYADIRYALRRLRQSPGFAVTAVAVLALGIGANVVVFSVLNGLILRPIGVPHPENVFQVARGNNGGDYHSYPDYADLRDRDASFSGLLAYGIISAGITIDKYTLRGWGYSASGNYFDVLGVKPALGRFFHSGAEHGLGSAPYIVLSNDFWRRQFGSSSTVLGRTVLLNQHPFMVIGVAPRNFRGADVFFWPDYWIPVVNAEEVTGWSDLCCRDHVGLQVLGRLKPGVTPQQATDSLNAVAHQMAKENSKDDGLTLRLRQPGPAGDNTDPMRLALIGIMLLAFMALLAPCANLASIFAARTADRGTELAVRLAIGASRWIVLRQLLVEAVIISLAGGLAGSLLARLLLGFLVNWKPFGDFPARLPILPDLRVYCVAIALAVLSGIFFGLLPARQIWWTEVVRAIKSGYVAWESGRRFAFRDILLAIQVVVCMVLGIIGVIAAMLSITGIFGAASYSVSKRMREQGIRMALGAQRPQVVRSMLARPAIVLLCGSVFGIGGALLTANLLAHIVSFAAPGDPLVLGGVILTMMLLGLIATWLPARRALAIDPAQLLRES